MKIADYASLSAARDLHFPYIQKATMTTEVCTRNTDWVRASELLINKTVSMKYEVPNIITHHHKTVVTSSLGMKVKHIKRTWISKIRWLYNSLLYKAGNSEKKCSLIPISSPVNPQSKAQWEQTCRPGKSVYSEAGIFTHSPSSLFLGFCHWIAICEEVFSLLHMPWAWSSSIQREWLILPP